MVRRLALVAMMVVVQAGCGARRGPEQPSPGAMQPAPAGVAGGGQPASVHWTRSSAEHDAIFRQTYRWAAERLRGMAAGRSAGTWGVILDADETVLDNSEYQRDLAAAGGAFNASGWAAWVKRAAAAALPGSADFIRAVHELGGRVVIVSNRDDALCDATRQNFIRLSIIVDLVMCRAPSAADKNARFQAVQNGSSGLPALSVLMWVGDNIMDFPDQTQAIRNGGDAAYAEFGARFIILPNPMYGSWERNPAR